MDKVAKLYENYEILADPKNKASDHEAKYLEILHSAKGDRKEKVLACQFIPRFLKDFPHLIGAALEAQIDLIEDEDISVRKQAIKYLPSFCKESKECVAKCSDILVQMLQCEDSAEHSTVNSALVTVIKFDVKAALEGIFSQILSTEEVVRKRAIAFLNAKFKHLPSDLITKEIEEYVFDMGKRVSSLLTGEDFMNLLTVLVDLKIAKTVPVRQAIVNLIADQAELNDEFQPVTVDVANFVHCTRQAIPFFSSFINSNQYVSYMCLSVLPKLDEIKAIENGAELYVDIIKLLAELSTFVIENENIRACTEAVYNVLLKYIPLPPPFDEENGSVTIEPDVQFTHIECLLYTFIKLLKYDEDFLTSTENSERFKDIKVRLQFLARGVQKEVKSLPVLKTAAAKEEEAKLRAIALNNINLFIRDMFRSPPSFKTTVTLSWEPTAKVPTSSKREHDSSSPRVRKVAKREGIRVRELYSPPVGKYSKGVPHVR